MKLLGRSAFVSGASQGLGFEIAKQLAIEGANVMLCARSSKPLKIAHQNISAMAPAENKILARVADVTEEDQLAALVADALTTFGQLDILVANAGIYGPKGPIEEVDWQEWSSAIDINLKGTVLQCRAVLKHFKQRRSGKIIILSGGGATKPMANLSAYCASKAGVVRFAEVLADEVKIYNIDVNTIAPGALNTRLLDEVLAAGPDKVGRDFYEQALKQQQSGGTPLQLGAKLCSFLASSASDGITGKLISAVWDPWEELPHYLDDLLTSDIYTLRRIIPQDRQKNWGS